jgi:hypothetical protein
VTRVTGQDVNFVISRGEKLSRASTAYDRDFDIKFGRAALKLNSDLTLGVLH